MLDDKDENQAFAAELLEFITHFTAVMSGKRVALKRRIKVSPDVLTLIIGLYNEGFNFHNIYQELM